MLIHFLSFDRKEVKRLLKEHPLTPELLICTQSFPWHPICHYYGCDLRPDRDFYKELSNDGPLDAFLVWKDIVDRKDKRTNPYNPTCFRCGKTWGMCVDGL